MKCPGGDLLSHENILSIFQACFRIGHYQTERSKDMSGEGHHCEMLARIAPPSVGVHPSGGHKLF